MTSVIIINLFLILISFYLPYKKDSRILKAALIIFIILRIHQQSLCKLCCVGHLSIQT